MKTDSEEQIAPAIKKCPYCAEPVLAEAKKCRFCGEFIDGRPRGMDFDKDMGRQVLAVIGSLLLVLAPFAPIVSAPILGRITLFQQGKGDGAVLLAAAVIALGFSTFGRYGFLWATGIIGLVDTCNLFYVFWFKLPDLIAQYRKQTEGNVFGSIGELTLGNIALDWGAAVLLIGTLLTLAVVVSLGFRRTLASVAGKLGLVVCGIATAYQILLFFFPYIKYWPTIFGF